MNSVINVNRIGRQYSSYYRWYGSYTAEGPLVCQTNNPTCCRAVDDPIDHEESGDWYYPDGTAIGNTGSGFYVTRERMEIWLNRYSYTRNGVYCCDVPSVNSTGNMTEGVVSATNFSTSNASTTAKCVGIYDYGESTVALSPTWYKSTCLIVSAVTLRMCPDHSIFRGYVSYDSPYIPGRVATYSCRRGYSIVGSITRTCTAWGWSGNAPTCQGKKLFIIGNLANRVVYTCSHTTVVCGPLDDPNNGHVDTSQGTTRGSVATYSCNNGYRLKGSNTRSCGYYGRWSGSAEPICVGECT